MVRYGAGFLGLLLALLAVPAAASAALFPWEMPSPPNFAAKLDLKRNNGYTIAVEGWGHNVKLIVTRQEPYPPQTVPSRFSNVEYLTHGTVKRGRVEAEFPGLGELSVRFKPSPKSARTSPPVGRRHERSCETTTGSERPGAFVGTIDFTGENGYFAVHTHRAKGVLGKPPRLRGCGDLEGTESTAPSHNSLAEQSASPGRSLYFQAEPISSDPATQQFLFLAAGSLEQGETMTISRKVLTIAPANTVVFDSSHGSITVLPPPPFSGTGVFHLNADGSTGGTGSLAVLFPGEEGRVALAGPQFSGSFTR